MAWPGPRSSPVGQDRAQRVEGYPGLRWWRARARPIRQRIPAWSCRGSCWSGSCSAGTTSPLSCADTGLIWSRIIWASPAGRVAGSALMPALSTTNPRGVGPLNESFTPITAHSATAGWVASHGLPRDRIPDPHRPVIAAGGQPIAIRRERNRADLARTAGRRLLWISQGKGVRSAMFSPDGYPPRTTADAIWPPVRPLRAEPETARQETRLEDRLEHDLHRSLHDPVPDRGDGGGIVPRRPVILRVLLLSLIRSIR